MKHKELKIRTVKKCLEIIDEEIQMIRLASDDFHRGCHFLVLEDTFMELQSNHTWLFEDPIEEG